MTADPRNDYLAAYRRSVDSSTEIRDANLAAVLERAGHVAAVEPATTRWAASALIIKFTTVALVTTGLGWGAVSVLSDDSPPPPPPPAPVAVAAAQPTPAPTSTPHRAQGSRATTVAPMPPPSESAPEPLLAVPSAPRVHTVAPEPLADDDRLREELALLEDAQQHLRSGEIGQANRALREHARRFPQGTLWVERSAWSAIAACSGAGPQPKAAARSFILTHEDTPLGAKVKVECGL